MITVNAMGDACPIPVIKTKKAIQKVTGAETIEVLVDNEIAVQNVTKMAQSSGGTVTKNLRLRFSLAAQLRRIQKLHRLHAYLTAEEIQLL